MPRVKSPKENDVRKPDAGNPPVRFDEGAAAVIGFRPFIPCHPSYSTFPLFPVVGDPVSTRFFDILTKHGRHAIWRGWPIPLVAPNRRSGFEPRAWIETWRPWWPWREPLMSLRV
jgi:hypothetical protein